MPQSPAPEFQQAFQRLSPEQRRLLQLLALLQLPSAPFWLTRAGDAILGGKQKKRTIEPQALDALVKPLKKAKLIRSSGNQLRCNPEISEWVARSALADGSFAVLDAAIGRHLERYYGYRAGCCRPTHRWAWADWCMAGAPPSAPNRPLP